MVALAVVLIALAGLGSYLSWTARRLDRLHRRVETAAAALDAQLLRRAAASLAAAGRCALVSPERAERLAAAARTAQAGEGLGAGRELEENGLSRALRATFPADAVAGEPELRQAARRVALARSFYNDAVRDTRTLRARRLPRLAHLAGRAELPAYFEIDDGAAFTPDAQAGPPLGSPRETATRR